MNLMNNLNLLKMSDTINDYREIKQITLRADAKSINVCILKQDTHINYISESHPNKNIIYVVEGHWKLENINNNIVTLKEI